MSTYPRLDLHVQLFAICRGLVHWGLLLHVTPNNQLFLFSTTPLSHCVYSRCTVITSSPFSHCCLSDSIRALLLYVARDFFTFLHWLTRICNQRKH